VPIGTNYYLGIYLLSAQGLYQEGSTISHYCHNIRNCQIYRSAVRSFLKILTPDEKHSMDILSIMFIWPNLCLHVKHSRVTLMHCQWEESLR